MTCQRRGANSSKERKKSLLFGTLWESVEIMGTPSWKKIVLGEENY
jgi:hypothetical protein